MTNSQASNSDDYPNLTFRNIATEDYQVIVSDWKPDNKLHLEPVFRDEKYTILGHFMVVECD